MKDLTNGSLTENEQNLNRCNEIHVDVIALVQEIFQTLNNSADKKLN